MAHQWQPSQKNTKKYRAEIEAFGVPRGKVAQPRVTSDSWKPPMELTLINLACACFAVLT